jgi:hypothetical protein
VLPARCNAQKSSADAPEFRAQNSSSDAHVFGYGDAQNLLAPYRRIVLQSTVAARDEQIIASMDPDQAVEAETTVALHKNNVSSAQVRLGSRLHIDHLAIANRRRHTGSACLKADAESGVQTFYTEGLELLRLRTVFWRGINAATIGTRTINTHPISHEI